MKNSNALKAILFALFLPLLFSCEEEPVDELLGSDSTAEQLSEDHNREAESNWQVKENRGNRSND